MSPGDALPASVRSSALMPERLPAALARFALYTADVSAPAGTVMSATNVPVGLDVIVPTGVPFRARSIIVLAGH